MYFVYGENNEVKKRNINNYIAAAAEIALDNLYFGTKCLVCLATKPKSENTRQEKKYEMT